MKVAVIGANGQLGEDLVAAFESAGEEVVRATHQDVDIASKESVQALLDKVRPSVVINTAAFHNVEKCEVAPDTAFTVNALGARNLAECTALIEATVVHISTDYVFDGAKGQPYLESDLPGPLNVYGNSKLAGEHFVRANNPRSFVVRVSGIYGHHPCRAKGGMNFVETMLKLAGERDELRVVDDEFLTPTATREIGKQLVGLAKTSDFGTYHATAEGSCSWYEFARAIFEINGNKIKLDRARPGEFAVKVKRPKYSVLENAALKKLSLNSFRHWRQGLEDYLAQRTTAKALTVV